MNEPLEKGTILNNRYKIVDVLGQGGMSNVYLVEDEKLHSQWALKEMLDIFPQAEKGKILEQFKKEARILASMKHSNLPRVFDYFEEDRRHYLVMEYIKGLTLEEIFEKEKSISPGKILDWAIQTCGVLDSLHKEGIIYRDLKPGNVMVDSENRVYLIDFGIARLFAGGKIHDTIIIGTPGFASPEHHGKSETDARSDIFSLGATMHFLLTGIDPQKIPFVFKNPSDIKPEIPRPLSDAVMKAVALDPSMRFQSAREMKDCLVGSVKPLSKKRKDKSTDAPDRIEYTGMESVYRQPKGTYSDMSVSSSGIPRKTAPLEEGKFSTDPVRSFLPSVALSGGTVFTATIIIFGGIPTFLAGLLSVVAVVPLTLLYKELMKYLFKSPSKLTVNVRETGLDLARGEQKVSLGWSDITGLLIFQEKSRLNTYIIKYKLFTKKGNFEYGGEMGNVSKFNQLIIEYADLQLERKQGDYKRYGRASGDS